jgi:hypothetical protein
MDKQKEYSVAKEIAIVSSVGFFLGVFILIIGLLIVEFLKG